MEAVIPKVILCATDFSEPSKLALVEAIELARRYGVTTLHLLSVGLPIEPLGTEMSVSPGFAAEVAKMEDAESDETRKLAEATARESGLSVAPAYRAGPSADEIVRYAREIHADFLVIGTHGRTGLRRLFLGSVAEVVLRHAPCTVVAVRAREP